MTGLTARSRRHGTRRLAPAITAICLTAGAVLASPADAQASSSSATPTLLPSNVPLPPCVVTKQALSQGGPQVVLAGCGGRAFVLGPASDYQVYRNDSLQATIVDLRNGPQRRVFLISFPAANQPLLEDISGELALSAGRGPTSTVADLNVDFSGVATSGVLSVPASTASGTLASSVASGSINIGAQISQEQARLASSTGGN